MESFEIDSHRPPSNNPTILNYMLNETFGVDSSNCTKLSSRSTGPPPSRRGHDISSARFLEKRKEHGAKPGLCLARGNGSGGDQRRAGT